MRYAPSNLFATTAGVILMLVALACSQITLTSDDYRGVLVTALTCAALAVACLALPFVRGGPSWRAAAVILASPALYVLEEFARRAPYAFGGG
jgi:hypothetical protein